MVDDTKTSMEHTCECGKQKTWLVVDGMMSDPCPSCGTRYQAVYSRRGVKVKTFRKKTGALAFLQRLW